MTSINRRGFFGWLAGAVAGLCGAKAQAAMKVTEPNEDRLYSASFENRHKREGWIDVQIRRPALGWLGEVLIENERGDTRIVPGRLLRAMRHGGHIGGNGIWELQEVVPLEWGIYPRVTHWRDSAPATELRIPQPFPSGLRSAMIRGDGKGNAVVHLVGTEGALDAVGKINHYPRHAVLAERVELYTNCYRERWDILWQCGVVRTGTTNPGRVMVDYVSRKPGVNG